MQAMTRMVSLVVSSGVWRSLRRKRQEGEKDDKESVGGQDGEKGAGLRGCKSSTRQAQAPSFTAAVYRFGESPNPAPAIHEQTRRGDAGRVV